MTRVLLAVTAVLAVLLPPSSLASVAAQQRPQQSRQQQRQGEQKPWLDTSLTFEERARGLLAVLTLEEKFGQLNSRTSAITRLQIPAFDYWTGCAHGVAELRPEGATIFPMPLGLAATFDTNLIMEVGSIMGDEARAKANAAYQKDGSLMMTNCFDPNINILRDPRWGRGAETFGEDPLLTASMVTAFVRGLQWGTHAGDSTVGHTSNSTSARGFLKAGATCKHLAAYSLEEWEGTPRYSFDAVVDPRDLQDTYLPAFQACVREGVGSIMCAYNAVNGTPACASELLLNATLRRDWGFEGFVVSDCDAVSALSDPEGHATAPNPAAGAAAALKAGVDLACFSFDPLKAALAEGLVTQADIDQAVLRLLMARLRQGHFDHNPEVNPYAAIPISVVGQAAHLSKAREAASKGIVLLKNAPRPPAPPDALEQLLEGDRGSWSTGGQPTLPLHLPQLRNITVVGPLAHQSELLLGNYYGNPAGQLLSPYEALAARVGKYNSAPGAGSQPVAISYLRGSDVIGGGADLTLVTAACRHSDTCIFFLGSSMISTNRTRFARSGTFDAVAPATEGETLDRHDLLLPGEQLGLVQAAAKMTNATLVVVLLHGGPLDVSWMEGSTRVGAILTAWFPGQGAEAIADVLFGDVSPSGRLPVTFYYTNYTNQISLGDMRMRPWPGRTHRYLQVPVLYPFGHGLSYILTNYTLSPSPSSPKTKGRSGPGAAWLDVEVTVSHKGGPAGEEVVLLFLSRGLPPGAAVQQKGEPLQIEAACREVIDGEEDPLQEGAGTLLQSLVGFGRVSLQPWTPPAPTLRFPITAAHLAAFGASVGRRPPCGRYWLRAGGVAAAVEVVPNTPTLYASRESPANP